MPRTAGTDRDACGRGVGCQPAGAFGVVERAHRDIGRDGDPAVEGVRFDAGVLARDAGGVRPLADPRLRRGRSPSSASRWRELLATTLRYADGVLEAVEGREEPWLRKLRTEVAHYGDLSEAVVAPTVRRVLKRETVPAEEKVVSLFEPHTDSSRKSGRRVRSRTRWLDSR